MVVFSTESYFIDSFSSLFVDPSFVSFLLHHIDSSSDFSSFVSFILSSSSPVYSFFTDLFFVISFDTPFTFSSSFHFFDSFIDWKQFFSLYIRSFFHHQYSFCNLLLFFAHVQFLRFSHLFFRFSSDYPFSDFTFPLSSLFFSVSSFLSPSFQDFLSFYHSFMNRQFSFFSSSSSQNFIRLFEAEAYLKSFFYICAFGKDIFSLGSGNCKVDPKQYAEHFQVSWIKLRFVYDNLRSLSDSSFSVLSLYHPGRYFPSVNPSNGFDDLVIASSSSPGEKLFFINFIEQKMNHLDVKKLPRSSVLTRYLLHLVSSHLRFFFDILPDLNFPSHDRLKLFSMVIDRSLTYCNSIGLDFLRKIANGDLLASLRLIKPKLDNSTINRILNGCIFQHQLISLIKSGFTFRKILHNGFFTIKKDDKDSIVQVISCDVILEDETLVKVFFPSDLFAIKIDSRGYFVIPQFSNSQINFFSSTPQEFAAYNLLNNLFLSLGEDKIFNESILHLTPSEIIRKINQYQKVIFSKLISSNLLNDLRVFDRGYVRTSLEVFCLPESGSRIFRYLSYLNEVFCIFPYSYYQQWTAPFGNRITDMFSGSFSRDSVFGRLFKEKLMRYILQSSAYDFTDTPLEFIESKLRNSEAFRIYFDNFFVSFSKFPDGNFLRYKHSKISKKAVAFFNDETKQWLTINKKRFYFILDFEEIITYLSSKLSSPIGKELLIFPIKFSLNKLTGQLSAVFNTDFRNTAVNKSWKDFLKIRVKERLKLSILSRSSFGQRNKRSGIDLFYNTTEAKIKLLISILSEYINLWEMIRLFIIERVKKEFSLLSKNSIQFLNETEVIFANKRYKLTLLNYNESNSRVRWSFKTYLLPCKNSAIDIFRKKCESIYRSVRESSP